MFKDIDYGMRLFKGEAHPSDQYKDLLTSLGDDFGYINITVWESSSKIGPHLRLFPKNAGLPAAKKNAEMLIDLLKTELPNATFKIGHKDVPIGTSHWPSHFVMLSNFDKEIFKFCIKKLANQSYITLLNFTTDETNAIFKGQQPIYSYDPTRITITTNWDDVIFSNPWDATYSLSEMTCACNAKHYILVVNARKEALVTLNPLTIDPAAIVAVYDENFKEKLLSREPESAAAAASTTSYNSSR